jgi:hypothetical protein
MIGCSIGNLFLQGAWAKRIAGGNGRRFIIASALTKALKSGAPICVRILSEQVLLPGRAIGHTEARCSKRVFGGSAWGNLTPVAPRCDPNRFGQCHAGYAGA